MLNYKRYRKNPVMEYPERKWPGRQIEKAPVWCSVDLRDGNQALVEPMVVSEKIEMFKLLVKIGFKEIEIGFPSASQIEFDFLRELVKQDLIPDDVVIQVLTQCREELIERTFESIEGIKTAIVHIYNSTSTLQREVVFKKDKKEILQLAVDGTRMVKERAAKFPGKIILEYSPESYTGTEPDYAIEVCNAVIEEWDPRGDDKVIINLPSTVEMTTPNVFADRIEWSDEHLLKRENVVLSIHPHNDRGTGVATAELALLAGADRVEGTLFGNGERTGNVDILNIAYNMFSQGIDPKLDLSDVNELIDVYEKCTKMKIDPRHPYAGKLVFTAFSGSHQDAISKGVKALRESGKDYWEVPYLPIDPADIGREYEPIVRINSQSGKGGVAFIMDSYFGFKLPKGMHREFADVVQSVSEKQGEVAPDQVMELFRENYLEKKEPIHFRKISVVDLSDGTDVSDFDTQVRVTYTDHGITKEFEAVGNGPIDAVGRGLSNELGINVKVIDYEEHALTGGSNAQAAAYIHMLSPDDNKITYGVGVSSNITRASVRAVFSAVNRLFGERFDVENSRLMQ
ncbi:MAG: 2-isopropylmalate synthase [Lachnospiraceae bacterium]|nr:2-isopropylmalate synthase [Lachnospiraceae bacterium]